jgi:hypothetical protein
MYLAFCEENCRFLLNEALEIFTVETIVLAIIVFSEMKTFFTLSPFVSFIQTVSDYVT